MINVTFKYSNKLFNRIRGNCYVKFGYDINDLKFTDHICVQGDELIAIETETPVEKAASNDLLGKYFSFCDGMYHAKQNIKALHTVADLRAELYENGFYLDGIKYVRFKRSSGSSRVGKCLFIDERLYSRMHEWEMCGIKLKPDEPIDLAALEAYIALTLSSIIGTVEISANNILLIDDYESVFDSTVIETVLDNGRLVTQPNTVSIKNSIWDGQSLADESLFADYPDRSMLLLRARFFKSAAFKCNIAQWFADNDITDVKQLNGYTTASSIQEIKLITTPSSIKFLKFGTISQWLEQLEPLFGIVKHEKPTHYFEGRMVQTHYQLINTLQLSEKEIENLLLPSLNYLSLLKSDPAVLRYHIKYPADEEFRLEPLHTKNDIIYRLLGINENFSRTDLYTAFKHDLTKSFVKNLRCGHLLVHGNYSTLLGNPIEMLQQAIGTFDGSSQLGIGNIYSKNFSFNQVLLGSRSPHVTIGNIWLPTNRQNEQIERYFNLSNEIVCVNSIGEATLDRLSGADYDSDSLLLTDNHILIQAAQKNYLNFPVPVNHVQSRKTKRLYTPAQQADLDIRTSVNKIGEIINLSQELNTLLWSRLNSGEPLASLMDLYYDICQLDVMSGIEIDKAKKEFDVDNTRELKYIRQKHMRRDPMQRMIKPNFFGHVARQKGYYNSEKKNYLCHDTAMDYLERRINRYQRQRLADSQYKGSLKLSDILDSSDYSVRNIYYDQIERVFNLITDTLAEVKAIYSSDMTPQEKASQAFEHRQQCVEYIGNLKFNASTMICMLRRLETRPYRKIYRLAFNILFGYPNSSFFEVILQNAEKLPVLLEVPNGDIQLYDFTFSKV